MNAVKQVFHENKKILIPYICGGYPDLKTTIEIIKTLDNNKAGIIEVGIPFSDPLADGPVIQSAGQNALQKGVNLAQLISVLEKVTSDIKAPIVLMGYYNNIYQYGRDKFINDIKEAGIKGVIIPDLPWEEDPGFFQNLKKNNLAGILLAALNTPLSRIKFLGKKSTGFLYCVSLMGVTGDKKGPDRRTSDFIEQVKKNTSLPLGLGFGIDSPQKAHQVSKDVQGIIIGSAFIDIINQYTGDQKTMLNKIGCFTESIVNILDQ